MNVFLKIFVVYAILFLTGCATTHYGRQKQVADATAGAVVGGLLGYAVAGPKGAQKGAAAGAAIGAYTSSGAGAGSGASTSENLYRQQVEAAKNCRPGHSCLGDVLQGRMETKATKHAYEKGYREGDTVATKKVSLVAECIAKNQANIDHGLPVERDCSAIAGGATKAAGVGVGGGRVSSGVVVTPYVSRYYTNPIFLPQYYTYPSWGYGYNYNSNYNKHYRRGTRAWRNYNYAPSNVHRDFERARDRSSRNYDHGRGN